MNGTRRKHRVPCCEPHAAARAPRTRAPVAVVIAIGLSLLMQPASAADREDWCLGPDVGRMVIAAFQRTAPTASGEDDGFLLEGVEVSLRQVVLRLAKGETRLTATGSRPGDGDLDRKLQFAPTDPTTGALLPPALMARLARLGPALAGSPWSHCSGESGTAPRASSRTPGVMVLPFSVQGLFLAAGAVTLFALAVHAAAVVLASPPAASRRRDEAAESGEHRGTNGGTE